MHAVIASYLKKFSDEHEISDLPEDDRFERFINYCVLAKYYPEQFELDAVTTSTDDESIDGCAVLISDELILSADDAESVFNRLKQRQQVSVDYIFCQAKRSESFDSKAMLAFGAGVDRVFESPSEELTDSVLAEACRIHEVVVNNLSRVQNGRPRCHLHYVCTGVFKEQSGLDKYIKQVQRTLAKKGIFDEVTYEPVDREKLVKLWMQTREVVEANFAVQGWLPMPVQDIEEAYLSIVSASEFVEKVLSEPDGRMRTSVFDQNVRAFLGDANPVNRKIRDALEDVDRHGRFVLLNNGVTIVSPDVKIQNTRISVRDFQIVNGCQTSHVLFRNQGRLSENVWVPIKVIEVDEPGVVAEVVEATNSQTDVAETQFYSILPFVRKIEEYFNAFDTEEDQERRLYFERRTRQYVGQEIGKLRVFDIPRLARAFASMFLDVPHLAARYPTQTFREKADQLYQPEHRERAYYVAALALYRLELAMGNQYVPRKYISSKWHLLMAVKYLLAGFNVPALNSKKMDIYCDKILEGVSVGGRASAPPFLDAINIMEEIGLPDRDGLRRQVFTDALKAELKNRKGGKQKGGKQTKGGGKRAKGSGKQAKGSSKKVKRKE